jgi:hypothetical protein
MFAATGEVTLSGSTWTGKVDGTTKYTGTSLEAAANACAGAMSSGTINIRNSGTTKGPINIGSNITVDAHGVTITATQPSAANTALIHSQNTSAVGAKNLVMKKGSTFPWFGLYFGTCNGITVAAVSGDGGDLAYRVDDCKGGWGYNLAVGNENVSGGGSHGIETYGISGETLGTITSNNHSDGCGVLLQSYGQTGKETVGTVLATKACYGCGYAGFRTANTNRNCTITYDDATSCGRGYFSVSGSRDCTVTRITATNCTAHGVLIQTAANTHVNGGTVTNCHPCTLIAVPIDGTNSVAATCN